MPPGQSGHVSVTGLLSGTGSPHLTDQLAPFTRFELKQATFRQAGRAASPRRGVTIVRDSYGVPAITGASEHDAWWGAGWAAAEDRLFQLDLFRRSVSGRLAELQGDEYLDEDVVARRDFYTDAEVDAMVARLPARFVRRAEAIRDGINAYTRRARLNPGMLPGEFVGTATLPRDWTVRDTARLGIYLARTVPSSDGAELRNLRALKAIGPSAFARLLPLRTPGAVASVPRSAGVFPSQPGRTRRDERRAFRRSVAFARGLQLPSGAAAAARSRAIGPGGSYMWAITRARRPGRSRPTEAYLFNGPQLGFTLPEVFMELELHWPGHDLRGATAPGVPVIATGTNGRVAWGVTSGLTDVNDLYAERLTGAETYLHKGENRRMECRNERFRYRASPLDVPDLLRTPARIAGSRTERICRTVHGPVQARAGGVAYARRYTLWGRELETTIGLGRLNEARSVREVDRALRDITWSENIVAADDRGHIGYWHPGLHPLRPRGWDERLPYPGTGEAEWRGLLPRRRTPRVIDPPRGWVMSWNNPPSVGWTNGDSEARERLAGPFHRAAFLERLVAAVRRRPSYEASRRIDRTSGAVAQQRPLAGRRLRTARRVARGAARATLDAVIRWDGNYAHTDAAGTVDPGVAIWEELKTQAKRLALAPLGGAAADLLSGEPGRSHAFDITNAEAYALRRLGARSLATAAGRAADVLAARFGTADVTRWREPRRMYDVQLQGAAAKPALPFFDRGTFQESIALGP